MKTIICFLRNKLIKPIQALLIFVLILLTSWQYLRLSWLDERLRSVENDNSRPVVDMKIKPLKKPVTSVERLKPLVGTGSYVAPTKKGTVIEPYGWALFKGTNEWHFRNEMTIGLSIDKTVRAVDDGMVQAVVAEGSRWCVKIDHGNGVKTAYRNLLSISISQGKRIKKGDTLGKAEELVFGITRNGMPLDPTSLDSDVANIK